MSNQSEQPAAQAAGPMRFSHDGVLRGVLAMLPMALFVVPFGVAFGVAAIEKGIEPTVAILMSALMCAGASQFAAIDLWASPVPVTALMVTALIVNGRHLLYGAALAPYLAGLPRWQVYPTLAVMTDNNWAYAMQAFAGGERDAGVLLGGGLILWAVWVAATALGVVLGVGIGNPKTYGLDVVMLAFFTANLTGLWRGPVDLTPWLVAAVAALAALYLLPAGWHVIVGALAGGVVGLAVDDD
jgi:4-azaleucine resistance transporter AzlC